MERRRFDLSHKDEFNVTTLYGTDIDCTPPDITKIPTNEQVARKRAQLAAGDAEAKEPEAERLADLRKSMEQLELEYRRLKQTYQ